jgi:membrane-bound lytic murein transglycosylase B
MDAILHGVTGTDQDSPPALRSATPAAPARHRPRRSVWLRRAGRRTARIAAAAGRATHRWALRPSGRFGLPALALAALLVAVASVGGYLVPATAPAAPQAQPPPPSSGATGDMSSAPVDPAGGIGAGTDPDPLGTSTADPSGASADAAAPAAVLAGWAGKLSPAVGIPVVALQAYGYAQLWTQQTQPSCHLTWTTLAGIGKAESDHGQEGGSSLLASGKVDPPIIGPTLDGTRGDKILDTDGGRLDNDPVYDHAVGPMQFVPGTWDRYQIDADRDGVADPNDINDAALAAAKYLCANDRNLSVPGDWWAGIFTYNDSQAYADKVFDAANEYGERSRDVS